MSTLAQRVDAGFAKVTEDLGPGWTEKVNTQKLDFSSVMHDLLGQLYGSYATGLQKLELTYDHLGRKRASYVLGAEHGFDTVSDAQSYATLRSEWVRRINAARKELS